MVRAIESVVISDVPRRTGLCGAAGSWFANPKKKQLMPIRLGRYDLWRGAGRYIGGLAPDVIVGAALRAASSNDAGYFIKFDKIWRFIDFSGAVQRSVYLGKRTA